MGENVIPNRRYDIEGRELYAEIGFWLIVLSISLPVVLVAWGCFPAWFPCCPSRFWIAALPTFLLSLVFWVPFIICCANMAFPD
jgi:hypothetical protein